MSRRHWLGLSIVGVVIAVGFWWAFGVSEAPSRGPAEDGTGEPAERVSLRLPIPVADTAFSPYYLAVDEGIFARYGLEVTLEPGTPELNPVRMLAQGTDEFGVLGGPELLLSGRGAGAPLVAVALLHRDADFVVILTLADSGLTSLEQLQGHRIGFFYGHISTDVLRMLLAKEGIEVKEVDVGFDYGQLLSGQLAGQWAFRTTAGISLPARGVAVNVISPADYGLLTQGHVLVTNEQMINERPEIVQRFVSAVIEATELSVRNRAAAVEATMRRDPNFEASVGNAQMEVYANAILRNDRIGWIPPQAMTLTKEQMVNAGLLEMGFPLGPSFTNRFVDAETTDDQR